ncbi:MAG: response regulator, partial [Chthoniobacterales bacterium]
ELHGGNVRVMSDGVGRGATFSVCLPLQSLHEEAEDTAEARRNAEIDRAAMKSELTGIKVLVVDDEEDSVTIVRRILERRGALVRSANSMNEALAEFATFSPNVILSDIGMPGNDGYELISRLRAMPGGRAVPAVALTALARGEDRTRALHAGFQMHVTKPVDFNELVAVVQNLASLRSEDR